MPLMEYRCPVHGAFTELVSHRTDHYKSHACPECGSDSPRVFTSPAIHVVEFTAGFDRSANQYFDTKRQRDNWLQEKGLRKIKD